MSRLLIVCDASELPEAESYGGRMLLRAVPDGTEIWRPSSYEELAGLMPHLQFSVIVPMGGNALKWCTGMTNIMDWRGYIIDPASVVPCKLKRPKIKKDGTPGKTNETVEMPALLPAGVRHIIPTISVETVQKSGLALLNVMRSDLARAARFAANPDLPISATEAFTFRRDLSGEWGGAPTAIDVETNREDAVQDIAFATETDTITTPWTQGAAQCLEWLNGPIIAHNWAFDAEHIWKSGGRFHPAAKPWCSMLAAYMLNPDGKKSLNWVISQYLDARRHKHLMGSEYFRYNALDGRQTRDLYPILRAGLQETGQLEFFEQGMMRALPTLVRMHMRGIRVDLEWVEKWRGELAATMREIEQRRDPVLLEKPLKLARHLGTKNADEETLLKLKIQGHVESELIDDVLAWRAAAKNHSTYLQNFDRVYPNYLPGARDVDEGNKGIAYSGRPTASHPNIQNQPKEARRQYVADTGMVLVSLDWSQIEPRIAARLSGDDIYAADIEAGLYNAIAATIGCDRDTAKTVTLLSAYLGSPRVLQNKLMLNGVNKTFAECKQLQDRMFARYPKWYTWRQGVIAQAESQRWLRNVFGKWAPFIRSHAAKAVNFHPQSCAACILWHCLPKVEKALEPFGGSIYCTVHDEITVQVPDVGYLPATMAVKSVMEQPWPQLGGLSVPVKIKVGTNWREMDELVVGAV